MPYGYRIGVALHGLLVALVLASPRRPRWLASLAFRVSAVYNEVPFLFILLIAIPGIEPAVTGRFTSPGGAFTLTLAILVISGLSYILWRAARARPVVHAALDAAIGTGGRDRAHRGIVDGSEGRPSLARMLLFPFVLRPRGIERFRDLKYGDAGREHQLDLYAHRDRPPAHRTRSSTRSCRAVSTRSTCSTRCASQASWMAWQSSRNGYVRASATRLLSGHPAHRIQALRKLSGPPPTLSTCLLNTYSSSNTTAGDRCATRAVPTSTAKS